MYPTALNVYDASGNKHLDIKHDDDYIHIHSHLNTNFHINSDINIPTKYDGETGFINIAEELKILKNMINSINTSEPEPPEATEFTWSHLGPAVLTGTTVSNKTWWDLDKPLYDGKRLVLTPTFITQLYYEMGDWSDFHIGLKADDWNNTSVSNYSSAPYGYEAGLKLRFYRNASLNAMIFSIMYNGTQQNGFYNVPIGNIGITKGFIEITDNGNRLNFGISDSSSDNASTTSYTNWTGKKYTTFDIQRNFTSKDIIMYWSKAGNYTGVFNTANIAIGASNEVDVP